MPYFHLPHIVIGKQYGQGEMSQVVIFVSVYYSFAFWFCTYSLSSGSRLSKINHFFWRRIASLHLPSFFVPCQIFCIFVLLGWSLKKAKLTLDLHTELKPLWWQ